MRRVFPQTVRSIGPQLWDSQLPTRRTSRLLCGGWIPLGPTYPIVSVGSVQRGSTLSIVNVSTGRRGLTTGDKCRQTQRGSTQPVVSEPNRLEVERFETSKQSHHDRRFGFHPTPWPVSGRHRRARRRRRPAFGSFARRISRRIRSSIGGCVASNRVNSPS